MSRKHQSKPKQWESREPKYGPQNRFKNNRQQVRMLSRRETGRKA